MKINGKVYCFFEQSGTFKNEFIKLGIPAEDYDIQNNFGETDHIIDLFDEIDKSFEGGKSVFDDIHEDDFIIAFYPCIEFSCVAQMWYSLTHKDFKKWENKKIIDYIIRKNHNRSRLFEILIKFCSICLEKKIRMVFENPWSENAYLKQNIFLKKPSIIDTDRTRRGDFFIKPTAFWFWNCEPCNGFTYQPTLNKNRKKICKMKKAPHAGLCSEDRSIISSDYARNFICDFIIGKKQQIGQLFLF